MPTTNRGGNPISKKFQWVRGTVLHPAGDPIEQVYFPLSGMVSILAVMRTGEQIETNTTIVIPPLSTVPDRNVPTLTDEAKELLLEAAESRDGAIMHVTFIDDVAITTNGKQFAEAGNPQSLAAWEAALDELQTHNLIQPLGPKREVYHVTREGYQMAKFLHG